MIELGAIEVIPAYRGTGTGKTLLAVSFMGDEMEDYLVITTEYYWHWDLKGTGLNVWDYRKMMERMMSSAGFEYFATDDPEITSHPANCLMAREENVCHPRQWKDLIDFVLKSLHVLKPHKGDAYMIVEEIMNEEPYTLAPTNTVLEALKLMREKSTAFTCRR